MKQIFLINLIIPLFVIGQTKYSKSIYTRCYSVEYMNENFKKYPEMKRKHEQLDSVLKEIKEGKIKIANYEDTTATKGDTLKGRYKNNRIESTQEVIPWIVRIPVVIHVVYKNATENISDAQIQSQIDVLNRDFRFNNSDKSNIPSVFAGIARDARIEFCLATIDPFGNTTNGITRTSTSVQSFRNDVKYTSSGGRDIWNRDNFLNIWVCRITPQTNPNGTTSDILGYAQFPNTGIAATDGVVIDYHYFGTTGTATYPYNLGRTATHEIGHWLNLKHIWGDANCGNDDVDDTPTQQDPNGGCPTFPVVTCNNGPNGDMFMNYMDYTDDRCMFMFTAGQRDRMMGAIFVARNIFSTYNNISVDGNPIPTDNYGSNKSLTSIGKVNNGSTVNFRSGDMVRLQPGFRANQGSNFRARANQCVCSGNLSNITQHNPYRISIDSSYSKSNELINSKQRIVNIYPNPTSSKSATIEYKVDNKGMVRVYVMNSLGMHVKDLVFDYNHATGNYSIEANLAEFSSGLYYIAIKDFSGYEVKKLVIE